MANNIVEIPPPIPPWALAIELRRQKLKQSQETIAANAEMSQAYYSKIARGAQELTNVTQGRLVLLAKALDWTLLELQENTGVDLGINASVNPKIEKTEIDNVKPLPLYDGIGTINQAPAGHMSDFNHFFFEAYDLSKVKIVKVSPLDELDTAGQLRGFLGKNLILMIANQKPTHELEFAVWRSPDGAGVITMHKPDSTIVTRTFNGTGEPRVHHLHELEFLGTCIRLALVTTHFKHATWYKQN